MPIQVFDVTLFAVLFKFVCFGNCRFLVFCVVDYRFSEFFVDVDFPQKLGCRCRQNGLKSCSLQFAGPPYVPPLNCPLS